MGQKIVALDTSVFIYVLEGHTQFGVSAKRVLRRVERGTVRGVFSVIGMIELCTGPKKYDRYDLASEYVRILESFPNLTIGNLNERIVWLTSDLRAKYNIATPDAIHLATAIDAGAGEFITSDKALRKVKEIKVTLLK